MHPSITLYSPSINRSALKSICSRSHINCAVEGISCISPTAPASETASFENPLSALIIENTSDGEAEYFEIILRHGRRKESANVQKAIRITDRVMSTGSPIFFHAFVIKIQYEKKQTNFPVQFR